MGQFSSVDVFDLERVSRFGNTTKAFEILKRRPDLNPLRVVYHPEGRTSVDHDGPTANMMRFLLPTSDLLTPASKARSNAAGAGLNSDLLRRTVGGVQQMLYFGSGSTAPQQYDRELIHDEEIHHFKVSREDEEDQNQPTDSKDFVLTIPEEEDEQETTAAATSTESTKKKVEDKSITRLLPKKLEIVPTQGSNLSGAHSFFSVRLPSKLKPSTTMETNASKILVRRAVTSISMSPFSWALDHLNIDLIRSFLEAPLVEINTPVAFVSKHQSASSAHRTMYSNVSYTLTALEYIIVFKMCPHLFAGIGSDLVDGGIRLVLLRFEEVLDILMDVTDVDMNRKSPVRKGRGSDRMGRCGGESLLHLAIKYYAWYGGTRRAAHDAGLRSTDEFDGPERLSNSDMERPDTQTKLSRRLWCKRHRCMMPIINRDVALMDSMQLEKQRVILQKLLDRPSANLELVEDVEQSNLLHYAVNYNSIDALKLILKHPRIRKDEELTKRLMNGKDVYDMTPLYRAVKEGRLDLAYLLVETGSDYFLTCCKSKQRAIDLIFKMGASTPSYRPLMQLIDSLERRKVSGTHETH